MKFLKYSIFFLVIFLVLCIPVSDRPLFLYAYDVLSPVTKKIFMLVEKEGKQKMEEGKEAGVKRMLDAVPDKINIPKSEEPLSIEEKEMLEQIL